MKDNKLALEQLSTIAGGLSKPNVYALNKGVERVNLGRKKHLNKRLQAEEEHCCSDCDCGSQFCPDCKHH